jgi:hypothetical protein
MPARCSQRHQSSAGKDASSAMTFCHKRHCQWAEASTTRSRMPAQQGHWCQRVEGKDASTNLEVTPARQGQRCQRNARKGASAMLAKTPAQRWQRHQLCNNNVLRAASQWGRSQRDWSDDTSAWRAKTPAQCWQQRQRNKAKYTSTTRATKWSTPAQQGH